MNSLSIKTGTEAGKWGGGASRERCSVWLSYKVVRKDKWCKYFKTRKSGKAEHTCLDISGTTATGDFRTKKH